MKEFECKKAADSYARASTARTGVLDMSSLHTYKFNEDLFKKVTVVPEGKNHGLVFVLTGVVLCSIFWRIHVSNSSTSSGSVRKWGIPFDVYAFTNEWRRRSLIDKTGHCGS